MILRGHTSVGGCTHPSKKENNGKKCTIKIYALGDEEGQISCAKFERVLGKT